MNQNGTGNIVPKNMKNTLSKIIDLVPAADALKFFNKMLDAYSEGQRTEREIAQIDLKRDILMKEMELKYSLYREVFDRLFEERKEAIDKIFLIIDTGIKEKDKESISVGMRALSEIVSKSPLIGVRELSELMNSGQTITL